jgi:ectoine hydroxylase-related dioxygenase (phytanoyl-CoA dioxygenase family)
LIPDTFFHEVYDMPVASYPVSDEQIAFYQSEGYLIVRGLISPAEVAEIREIFEEIGRKGEPIPRHWEPAPGATVEADPLKRFPRVMQPHRFNERVKQFLLDPRIVDVLRGLLGQDPIAAQSMYYYKPVGARGQAFHQDDYYLKTLGGDCIAAWVAIDPSLPENGGLFVSPKTHREEIACPDLADDKTSFTTHLVKPPEGHDPVPAAMQPGDVLFFNGRVIHGSTPNNHPTLWRRSLIFHYIPQAATGISAGYFPLLDTQGNVIQRDPVTGGGPCGTTFSSYAP